MTFTLSSQLKTEFSSESNIRYIMFKMIILVMDSTKKSKDYSLHNKNKFFQRLQEIVFSSSTLRSNIDFIFLEVIIERTEGCSQVFTALLVFILTLHTDYHIN